MHNNENSTPDATGETPDGLSLSPEAMLQLAHRAAELLVEWDTHLPGKDAWEGDFQEALENLLMENPTENGRPAREVLEQAAHHILPTAARHQHPRFLAFVPSSPTWPGVLADFLVAGYNINAVLPAV